MPELVPMPKLGFDMAEGTLVRKLKQAGEPVKKGEVLAEIETDKATVEVEAPSEGEVKAWVVEEGQPVPVGALMAVIGAPGEQVDVEALKRQAQGAQSGAATKAAATDVPQGGAMGKVSAAAGAEPVPAPAPADVHPAGAQPVGDAGAAWAPAPAGGPRSTSRGGAAAPP
jgi:pyruvate dehydrogenase E2 component (dihydrolipoamide acetyltransferase)